MTHGTTDINKPSSDDPPSYAAVVSVGQPSTGPSRAPGIAYSQAGHHPEIGTHHLLPHHDPRSQAAMEAARNRAIIRFFEALLWAIVIYAIVAAILGGSIWPDKRHWLSKKFTR